MTEKVRLEESEVMGTCVVHEDGSFYVYNEAADAYLCSDIMHDVEFSFHKEKGPGCQPAPNEILKRYFDHCILGSVGFWRKKND